MTSPETPPTDDPDSKTQPKKRRGCFFYGCVGTIIMVVVLVVALYVGYRYAIERFTDTKPMVLPRVQGTVEQIQRLQARVLAFTRAIEEHKPGAPLILTADEANVLIQTDPNWASLKDHLYVAFDSNRLNAQFSFPAELLGSPRLKGRYLNAAGTFEVSLHSGELQVMVESVVIKGQPVSETIMRLIRSRNFALSFTNADSGAAISKVRDVEIKDGKLVIVPKETK